MSIERLRFRYNGRLAEPHVSHELGELLVRLGAARALTGLKRADHVHLLLEEHQNVSGELMNENCAVGLRIGLERQRMTPHLEQHALRLLVACLQFYNKHQPNKSSDNLPSVPGREDEESEANTNKPRTCCSSRRSTSAKPSFCWLALGDNSAAVGGTAVRNTRVGLSVNGASPCCCRCCTAFPASKPPLLLLLLLALHLPFPSWRCAARLEFRLRAWLLGDATGLHSVNSRIRPHVWI